MTRPSVRLAAAMLLLTTTLIRCGGDGGTGPDPSKPSALSLVSGDAQTGTVGHSLSQPLVVRVLNSQGDPISGATVTWSVIAGDGLLSAASTATDAQGDASVTWTLGTTSGTNNNSTRATVVGLTGVAATFTATATADVATQLTVVSGNAQTTTVGQALSQPLVVAARDQYGNGVSGKTVDWSVTAGGGQLSSSSLNTNAQGQASVTWTIGTSAGLGNQGAQATVTGLTGSPASFTASATAGAATQLLLESGNNQSAEVAHALSQPVVVLVRDQYDNPVRSVPVAWSVTSGGGNVSANTVNSDASGHSSVTWTLGTGAGAQTARARLGTTGPLVAFAATGNPGPASKIVIVSGNDQSAGVTQTLGNLLVVRTTDTYGNGIAGIAVGWAVTGGGGSIAPNSSTSDTQGAVSASFTLGTLAGSNAHTVTASASGLTGSPALFRASALAGPAEAVTAISGTGQTGFVGVALTNPLTVRVTDHYGNPVSGFQIGWSATGGGGAFATSPTPSDAGGNSLGSWTLGTIPGANAAQAVATGLAGSPILFDATGRAGPPSAITRISGDAQADTAGATLSLALVAELRDPFNNVIPDATVNWTVSGGGSVAPTASTTDGLGRASAVRTLGTAAGTNNNPTTATPDGVPSVHTTFGASVNPGTALQISVESGNAQTARAATVLPDVLQTRVIDAHGNGVAGVAIQWQAAAGSGTTSAIDVVSGTGGLATARWTLGLHPGTDTASATATGLPSAPVANFIATATPNGTIAGNVALSNDLLSPPLLAKATGSNAPAAPVILGTKARSAGRGRGVIAQSSTAAKPPTVAQATPDELIVIFRADRLKTPALGSPALATAANVQSAAAAIRSRLAAREAAGELRTRGVSPVLLAAKVQVADPSRLDETAANLRSDPDVAVVERNGLMWRDDVGSVSAAATPNDLYYPYQAWHYAMIDAPEAWQITHGSSAILVAIVDDGIRFDHPGVAANLTTDGYDFVPDTPRSLCAGGTVSNAGDGNGYDPDPTIPVSYQTDPSTGCVIQNAQYGGHGLHVAGTIGEVGNDGFGGSGLNWTVRIRPVRVLGSAGSGSFYEVAQGVLYAAGLPADNGAGATVHPATGARIINMSLGSPSPSAALESAVIAATNAGSLIIASAGNAGSSVPNYPAALAQVVSVSAVGPDGQLASYSSYGPTVDIAAPGGDFADGDISFGVISTFWDFFGNSPEYFAANGTSMAAPHVTGAAALLLAQNPSLTAAQLRARLTDYAVDIGAAGPDDFYGAGLLNVRNSMTQTFDYARALYTRLYDANTGAAVATIGTGAGGSYQFNELDDRAYTVYAGQDQAGDHLIGEPGRRWSAYGGTAVPTGVLVDGAGTYPVSFTIGYPSEAESNDDPAAADALAVGGYLIGFISSPSSDADYTIVRIPAAGVYTFETVAVDGACGFALEEDTVISLYDSVGTLVGENDDIDSATLKFCARLQVSLAPGTYFVRVIGFYGGRYQLRVGVGS